MKNSLLLVTISQLLAAPAFCSDVNDYKNSDGFKKAPLGKVLSSDVTCLLAISYIDTAFGYKEDGISQTDAKAKLIQDKMQNKATEQNLWRAKFVTDFAYSHSEPLDSKTMTNECKYAYFNEK